MYTAGLICAGLILGARFVAVAMTANTPRPLAHLGNAVLTGGGLAGCIAALVRINA